MAAIAVSNSAVVTWAPRPVRSRSRSAARMAVTAHMPVPMSMMDMATRAGACPRWPFTDMMPPYACIRGS